MYAPLKREKVLGVRCNPSVGTYIYKDSRSTACNSFAGGIFAGEFVAPFFRRAFDELYIFYSKIYF